MKFIFNFKSKKNNQPITDGNFITISFNDSHFVSFRTVVEDELWLLRVCMPEGYALKMENLCRQIIKETIENEFDEGKYIRMLE